MNFDIQLTAIKGPVPEWNEVTHVFQTPPKINKCFHARVPASQPAESPGVSRLPAPEPAQRRPYPDYGTFCHLLWDGGS